MACINRPPTAHPQVSDLSETRATPLLLRCVVWRLRPRQLADSQAAPDDLLVERSVLEKRPASMDRPSGSVTEGDSGAELVGQSSLSEWPPAAPTTVGVAANGGPAWIAGAPRERPLLSWATGRTLHTPSGPVANKEKLAKPNRRMLMATMDALGGTSPSAVVQRPTSIDRPPVPPSR
jgi:hypothetical protein